MGRVPERKRQSDRGREMTCAEARERLRHVAARERSGPSALLRKYPKTSLVIAVGAGILLSASPVARKAAMTAAVHYFLRR